MGEGSVKTDTVRLCRNIIVKNATSNKIPKIMVFGFVSSDSLMEMIIFCYILPGHCMKDGVYFVPGKTCSPCISREPDSK